MAQIGSLNNVEIKVEGASLEAVLGNILVSMDQMAIRIATVEKTLSEIVGDSR